MQEFIDGISKLGWALIAAVVSFIVYVTLEKFKTRGAVFSYVKEFNSVGTTFGNGYFQNIEISVAGRAIKHLNFISLTIKNESNVDFENVVVKCWLDLNSDFLNFDVHHDQYQTTIPLEETFATERLDTIDKINDYIDENPDPSTPKPDEIQALYTHVLKNLSFNVPVWNRKDSVTFKFLVENFTGTKPLLAHPIEKKSINLIPSESEQEKNNKLGAWMLIVGHLLYVIVAVIIANLNHISNFVFWLFLIFSGLYLWIALVIYKIFQYLKSFFQ